MIGYLGTPGALVALPYRGGLDTSSDRPVSFVRTLSGKRKALLGARARREWSVSFDLIGSREVHGLVSVSQFQGPVMWYPADAVAGNMLSPQASGFDVTPSGATDAGLVALPDGSVARSVVSASTVRLGTAHGNYEMVPVTPGEPVSVGVWAVGPARFTGFWRDAAGAQVSNFLTPDTNAGSGWQWCTETLTPPIGAAYIDLQLRSATQYARPAISWGEAVEDRPGRGCAKAVVHGLSEALSVIARDDAYGSIGVTITEVG